MAEKKKVCKNCGHLTAEKKCPLCLSNQFIEKYKGSAVIFDAQNSIVAEKLQKNVNGKFAIKYG